MIINKFALPKDSFGDESFVQRRIGQAVVVDDDSLDDVVQDNLRQHIIYQCFEEEQIPNPFDNSEFDLVSNLNRNSNAKEDKKETPMGYIKDHSLMTGLLKK